MSRVGKQPITVPSGVTITADDAFITVKGAKGELQQFTMPGITVKQEEDKVIVTRESDSKDHRSKHGLMRSLVANMIIGVTEGFTKKLEINGVGFKSKMQGNVLNMALGFSHEINYTVPEGVTVTAEQNKLTVTGINKQRVGQAAAEIRAYKKPEPYKGKGIKYEDEHIVRKAGKSGKDGA